MAAVRAGLFCTVLLTFYLVAVLLQLLCRVSGMAVPHRWPGIACRLILDTLRIRVIVDGKPGPAGRLIISNHVSWIDILVIGSRENPCFLAKREVATWPVISQLAKLQDTVFLDRQRRRLIPVANRALADRLRQGRNTVLFPEGTTYDGTRRGRFLTSHLACLRDRFAREDAVQSQAAQAVALIYSDPKAAWVGDDTLLPHLWAVLKGEPIVCTMVYGPTRLIARGYDRKALGRSLAADVEVAFEAHARAGLRTKLRPVPDEAFVGLELNSPNIEPLLQAKIT